MLEHPTPYRASAHDHDAGLPLAPAVMAGTLRLWSAFAAVVHMMVLSMAVYNPMSLLHQRAEDVSLCLSGTDIVVPMLCNKNENRKLFGTGFLPRSVAADAIYPGGIFSSSLHNNKEIGRRVAATYLAWKQMGSVCGLFADFRFQSVVLNILPVLFIESLNLIILYVQELLDEFGDEYTMEG